MGDADDRALDRELRLHGSSSRAPTQQPGSLIPYQRAADASTPRMPVLPAFDDFGNIPPGSHGRVFGSSFTVGLDELKARFVTACPDSQTRQRIWAGWMEHRRLLLEKGLAFDTWVDGSFCTNKLNPGDVDFCVVYESSTMERLDANAQQDLLLLFDPVHCKDRYRCDPHPIAAYPFQHPRFRQFTAMLSHYTRVFGSDRNGRDKAILVVKERGYL